MKEAIYNCPELEKLKDSERNNINPSGVTQDYCRSFNFGDGCKLKKDCLAYKME